MDSETELEKRRRRTAEVLIILFVILLVVAGIAKTCSRAHGPVVDEEKGHKARAARSECIASGSPMPRWRSSTE